MLNFTVGPVMSGDEVLNVGGQSSPYFRTPEFSEIMKENEAWILKDMKAPKNSRCVFLTSSGTGAMESCVMNILNDQDKVLVVNGGSFGQRFVEMCELHHRNMTEIKCEFGHQVKAEQLEQYAGQGYTAFLINMDETSSGTLYDMKLVSDFCKREKILLIVDAVSAFIADELNMEEIHAAAVLTGSQKALALHPGVAVIALAPEALERIERNPEVCMYLSLKLALENGERGQTPFTPAVNTLLEMHARLKKIEENGGIVAERARIAEIANDFRTKIQAFPFMFATESPSNCVTSLRPLHGGAKEIIRIMKDEYHIWICPNGGAFADEVFRVGHIGNITLEDNQALINAFADMKKRDLL